MSDLDDAETFMLELLVRQLDDMSCLAKMEQCPGVNCKILLVYDCRVE